MTEQVDAHNEVTLITLCRDLKAATVPFEGKLTFSILFESGNIKFDAAPVLIGAESREELPFKFR